jgi:prepilin-type N-terminal cleavage/methylation domain-containing protein
MRTILATGNRRARSGFTLIELSIALFIIAIIMAVSVPSFIRSYNASLIDSTGRTVITSCQFARLNAVLHQQKVEFYIDLDKQVMWLAQTETNEADSAESSGQVLKTIEIPPRVGLVSAQVADEPLQQKGQVAATFYPNGTCDAFTVTFRGSEKGSGLAIVVDPVTSRAVPWPVKL